MMYVVRTFLLLELLFFAGTSAADQNSLPKFDGLVLHLDASQLAATQQTGPVPTWSNLAGDLGNFLQSSSDQQPSLVEIGDTHVVRFSGSHLRSVGNDISTESISVFVVVAPHANPGDFRGWISSNAPGRRDYETGFNLDLGPGPTRKLDVINAEGRGFGGFRDLFDGEFNFGTLHHVTLHADAASRTISLRVDGQDAGKRPYVASTISLAEMTLGARYYRNGQGEMRVAGPLTCDIAEVLIYDRTLSDHETDAVERYLTAKHATLAEALPGALRLESDSAELLKVKNPPAIQMLVPGFEVHEIPVELTNVNNVRFRDDGTLVTLGYNGDVHLLRDSDGDSLEDTAELFWKNEGSLRGPIGMLVTPKDYPHGQGIFTPSKGKVSLIVDKDGDDKADEEIVVATGWQEIPQNVDATGIAMAADGSLYFGLGTANYANAYLIDQQGVAHYDLQSDRGTVQRVSPDFKTRETVCTGIRFPIAFAFNRHGDLFCAEQEGATWLPNGNPFDELLHVVPDRHYGFPPRHPRHNPDVIDEPSVFDYAPQHQSTCGMVFNGDGQSTPIFGPGGWAGNAIVCGESRGKIWRTQLVKTDSGYVASTQLLACLQMLTVDACVAPNGDLVVACHSGPPDWGTGPTGMGKLFRIRMSRPHAARPVNAWANSPREIQVAFDRPLDPAVLRNVADRIVVQHGDFVRAGDQFETLVPPYAVVQRQLATPRRNLAVRGMALSKDRRSVLLQTDPMRARDHYAVSIPYQSSVESSTTDGIGQIASIDVDLTLGGVQAMFTRHNDDVTTKPEWTGWLPHVDWQVNDQFTRQSAVHDSLRRLISSGGMLTMQTRLDVSDLLRPKVQPGSTIDYQWPDEFVTLIARSSQSFQLDVAGRQIDANRSDDGTFNATIEIDPETAANVPLTVRASIAANSTPDWSLSASTNEDSRLRALPLRRFRLPWTSGADQDTSPMDAIEIAEIQGGNWGRGRRVFHSDAAGCFKCHAIHGPGASLAGSNIGPDLSNLVHRDYASVERDIKHPSFAINPDYLGNTVLLHDGRVLTGTLQTVDGQLILGDADGKTTRLERAQIDTIKPAEVSVMPKGIDEKLTADQFRDLMTFLLTPPPHMPLDSPLEAPPVRTQAEVAAVLAGAESMPSELAPVNVVLVAGKKDHGPGEHDYPAWQIQWGQLLAAAEAVHVDAAWDFPDVQQLADADVLVFFQKGDWDDQRQSKMDRYFDSGGGAVYIHWAVNGNDRADDFSRRIGLASKGGSIGYRHGPLALNVHNTDHPIMRNIEPLQLYDESYWRLTGQPENVTLFATSIEDGAARPQMWAYQRSAGRVFVSIPGHYSWTFDDPIFRTILLRAMAWTANQPIDRFNELVPLGARMAK
ncbi:ThuA domain-containing protein [Rhodopirellula sp. JC639]|uniref:ThuA domain-containing protein n=1 Tax=Stieleria mannarensis TaxID=2755585 RepID=UPI0015FF9480|nr:ThuA domain-containing protein [Rhodopirellula sp. JC639]